MFYFSLVLLLLVSGADTVLGLAVWLQASSKKINIIFALLALSFAIWSATGFYAQSANPADALYPYLVTMPFIAGTAIIYLIVLFSLYFPEARPNNAGMRRLIAIPYGIVAGGLVSIFAFMPKLMIAGVVTLPKLGNSIHYGPLYKIFPLYIMSGLIFALINLFLKSRHSKDRREHLQLSYIFIGFLLFGTVATVNNLIIPMITHNHLWARFGFLSTLFIIACFGYAIAAHHLFNLRPLIARSVAYVLLLTSLTGLYALAIFSVSTLLLRQTLSPSRVAINIMLAIMMAVTYQPMRRFFERVTDRIFYRERYDSQVVLDHIGTILASELELDRLLERGLREICASLRLGGGQFLIFDQGSVYKEVHYGLAPRRPLVLQETRQLHSGVLVADELEAGARKALLDDHGIRISLMLQTKGQIVGYLFLGDKLSGELYSRQDLTVLEILRKELAMAIVNAKSYEEIKNFNATLQERVHQATQRLRKANANLRTLDKAKDDFISMASHQLGTPLTAITGYLSMTLDDDKGNMTIAQREFVNYALEAAERMTAMSLDLLNVSRLNSGRFIIQREPVNVDQMVQQEITQLQPAANRKKLALVYQSPKPALPPVPLDLSKTRQVIMNFIDNAIYYTPSGSVTVKLYQDQDDLVLTVTDTGIGVPPAEHDHLFAKFYRAENARTVRPDGTGLGLYLAKQVIEDQGGTIIFQSEEGKGSVFGFRLPMNPMHS